MSDQSHAGANFLVPVCRVRFKGFPTVGSRVDFLFVSIKNKELRVLMEKFVKVCTALKYRVFVIKIVFKGCS